MDTPIWFGKMAFVSLINAEAIMIALGVYCVVAGASMAAVAKWFVQYRAILETFGGSLFLAGLGCAGAGLALVP